MNMCPKWSYFRSVAHLNFRIFENSPYSIP
jgi:hypothetical protein